MVSFLFASSSALAFYVLSSMAGFRVRFVMKAGFLLIAPLTVSWLDHSHTQRLKDTWQFWPRLVGDEPSSRRIG